jgi:hypothetical protein
MEFAPLLWRIEVKRLRLSFSIAILRLRHRDLNWQIWQ